MDFKIGRRRKHIKIVPSELQDLYPHELQLYTMPPSNEITLVEFEELALERLQVLRILELATHKGHRIFSTEWKDCVRADIKKENLHKFYRLLRASGTTQPTEIDLQARRVDHLSHFILRLAYCRSEDLRRWFLARELEFFRFRFGELSNESLAAFLKINNLVYVPMSSEEKQDLREELMDCTFGVFNFESTDFYKVNFTEVCNLVKHRRVFLKMGYAYIPNFELVSCILSIFRAKLNEQLAITNKRLPMVNDSRLDSILTDIHQMYTGRNYTAQNDKAVINIALLDTYSKKHYPLCMRHIHEVFRSTHHMKYGCRMQYGLFIKGIGVTFEDAMTFWREEFTKAIDGDTFDKQYTYAVKHQYGKVGSMYNYSPYSCIKNINENVGSGLHHGCPFKHWDAESLKQKLSEYGFGSDGIQDIVDLANKGHYQLACGKYFATAHGQSTQVVINHPNQYFEESMALVEDEKAVPTIAKKAKITIPLVKDIDMGDEMF